jgi:hypothetical protein
MMWIRKRRESLYHWLCPDPQILLKKFLFFLALFRHSPLSASVLRHLRTKRLLLHFLAVRLIRRPPRPSADQLLLPRNLLASDQSHLPRARS